MHERKRMMFERADAFVALPGGIGTLEELVEQLTWAQLGRHKKPILIANIEGFWDPLCALLDHMKQLGFIRAGLDCRSAGGRRGSRTSCRSCRQRGAGRTSAEGTPTATDRGRVNRLVSSSRSAGRTSPPRCGCRRDRG